MENVQDKSQCLGKLERCKNTIQHFKIRVDSYLYEPTTMALFETKVHLKNTIKKLSEVNKSLLEYLKSTNDLLPEQYNMVNFHIRETSELEFDFMEYTLKFRKRIDSRQTV
ncbi:MULTISPECIES: hypothetical protein [Maribacter]|uniref:Uncharacterized protein n=1 Tax=Maribacter dokdonensis TaxID=320912 RepID=A0A1H4SQ94_9FLAO|nr:MULTISPECIES: hypothetical protein [Maribacter]APA66061.1 hypothetical protein YQ22_18155 [Maribacter sp. 1_2014MBL_MicDiv]KSA13861.1 hypothetical protein I600_454 [Maribacter dokdonensis DSW-8]MBU2902593.1 hypothetical protein [Maribacter dokdonensis]MDP2524577.1 hypothetical protein [Maribacter dokdonensis]PHN92359.1 hypothetical protein CSC80_15465 [Maribacter sp. 6B07]